MVLLNLSKQTNKQKNRLHVWLSASDYWLFGFDVTILLNEIMGLFINSFICLFFIQANQPIMNERMHRGVNGWRIQSMDWSILLLCVWVLHFEYFIFASTTNPWTIWAPVNTIYLQHKGNHRNSLIPIILHYYTTTVYNHNQLVINLYIYLQLYINNNSLMVELFTKTSETHFSILHFIILYYP